MVVPPPESSNHALDPAGSPTTGSGAPLPDTRATGFPAPEVLPEPVLLASIVRPHGRRGEVVADLLTDFPDRFGQRTQLLLLPAVPSAIPSRSIELENFWFLRSRVVLKFKGVDSINDAELLRGFRVGIPAAQRAPLEDGSVYISELIGCRVLDLNTAAEVGEIVDVDRVSSSTDLLVVRRGANP